MKHKKTLHHPVHDNDVLSKFIYIKRCLYDTNAHLLILTLKLYFCDTNI